MINQLMVKTAICTLLSLPLSLPLFPAIAQPTAPNLVPDVAQPGEAPYDTYMRLGFAAMERKNYDTAVEYFRDALFYVPEDREATIAYWNARKALHDITNPSDRTPQTIAYDRYMKLGYDETNNRDYQSALINFNRALKERPGDFYATQAIRNVSSYIAAQKGQDLEDLDTITLDVADNPYLGESPYDRYMRLGYAAAKGQKYEQAADYFHSALSERPDDRLAAIAFWNMKHQLNEATSEASQPTNQALYDRYMRLGYDATQKHHFQEALNYFQAALAAKPNDEYAQQAVLNLETYLQQ